MKSERGRKTEYTIRFFIISAVVILLAGFCSAGERSVFFREEFTSLVNWKPLYFPKIKKHSSYSIEEEAGTTFLKAESSMSASGIAFRKEFSIYKYPRARWRWKINNVYEKGDTRRKSGDDYPVRIYINFKYDPGTASLGKRLKYGIARRIYGTYPPDSSLNYIWANRDDVDGIVTNPYADEVKMIIRQRGQEKAGQWVEEDVDILADYLRAFGVAPPDTASIAIMNDSDDTGGTSVSYVDYIEVYR